MKNLSLQKKTFKRKKNYPKDYKYAKFEILKNLNNPNKKYIFIDADSIVLGNLSYLTNYIKKMF